MRSPPFLTPFLLRLFLSLHLSSNSKPSSYLSSSRSFQSSTLASALSPPTDANDGQLLLGPFEPAFFLSGTNIDTNAGADEDNVSYELGTNNTSSSSFSPDDSEIDSVSNPLQPSSSSSSSPQQNKNLLQKRQSCPANSSPCGSSLPNVPNAAGSCCPSNSLCSTDAAGNVACCPLGSFCTGTVSVAPSPTNTPSTSPTSPNTAPATTTTTTAASSAGVTFINNPLFPYPILPSSFANAGACTAAYASCSTSDFNLCTQDLSGNAPTGFAVTISAPAGAGVTVVPSMGTVSLGSSSASAICASLRSAACPGSAGGVCSSFGSGTATTTTAASGGGSTGGNGNTNSNGNGNNGAGPSFLATTTQGFIVVTPGAGAERLRLGGLLGGGGALWSMFCVVGGVMWWLTMF